MNDDIVTRLRQKYQGQLPICTEAADEIERLRAECEKRKNLTELAYQSWVSDSWLEFVEQFDEAVRGE